MQNETQKKAVLAFDTSNYTSSVAACDAYGDVIADQRQLLEVKEGDRGLRQSQALFQHIKNLPSLTRKVTDALRSCGYSICAVAASDRPRPVEGSYMPVFLAGLGTGEATAAALGVPFYTFSHQEGHIAAACGIREETSEMLAFHLSGGTGEIVKVRGNVPEQVIGGISDISFGQLIDRVGVACGYAFPAGAALDAVAMRNSEKVKYHYSRRGRLVVEEPMLGPVHVAGAFANLSGIETECQRQVKAGCERELLITELFYRMSDALAELTENACKNEGIDTVLYVGGVSASGFIRSYFEKNFKSKVSRVIFGEPALSSDNACGTARLGMSAYQKCALDIG